MTPPICLRPGDEIELSIERLSHDGRGVAYYDSRVVFVRNALPGEWVRARIVRKKRKLYEAENVHLHSAPHADRTEPRCPHTGQCGGCAVQHLQHAAQLRWKQDVVLEQLQHFGQVIPGRVAPPVAHAYAIWGYRRRARLGVKWLEKKNTLHLGFREPGTFHLHTVRHCQVLPERLMCHFEDLHQTLCSLSVRSAIPQIEVLVSDGDAALCVRHLLPISETDASLLRAFEQRSGLRLFLQSAGAPSVRPLSEPMPDLYAVLEDTDPVLRLPFGPGDFTQIHFETNRRMIAQAIAWLAVAPQDCIADLFSGLGNFSFPLARQAQEVCGIEGDSAMVDKANRYAAQCGLAPRVAFSQADLYAPPTKGVPDWLQSIAHCQKILLDPPRSGALPVLEALLPRLQANKLDSLLYVSCHPATLARDAGYIVHQGGWQLAQIGIMDMFPHTAHIETMALFTPTGARQ